MVELIELVIAGFSCQCITQREVNHTSNEPVRYSRIAGPVVGDDGRDHDVINATTHQGLTRSIQRTLGQLGCIRCTREKKMWTTRPGGPHDCRRRDDAAGRYWISMMQRSRHSLTSATLRNRRIVGTSRQNCVWTYAGMRIVGTSRVRTGTRRSWS
jgi:hypothetical protein